MQSSDNTTQPLTSAAPRGVLRRLPRAFVGAISRRLSPKRMRDDRGAVTVMAAIMMIPVVIGSAAIGIDTANWYYQGERRRKSPPTRPRLQDPSTCPVTSRLQRRTHVMLQSAMDSFTTRPTSIPSKITVATAAERRHPNFGSPLPRLSTTSSAGRLGEGTQTITRTAKVAEYRGPVLMGSPCNLFGNEPNGAVTDPTTGNNTPITNRSAFASATLKRKLQQHPSALGQCGGTGADKQNGDRYASRTCTSGTSGCSGTTNSDYTRRVIYKLSVKAAVSSIPDPGV